MTGGAIFPGLRPSAGPDHQTKKNVLVIKCRKIKQNECRFLKNFPVSPKEFYERGGSGILLSRASSRLSTPLIICNIKIGVEGLSTFVVVCIWTPGLPGGTRQA